MKAFKNIQAIILSQFPIWVLVAVTLVFTACSKNIDVKIPPGSQQVAVDGSIENGVPPVVLLTKSQDFFGNINLNDLNNYFIHGAHLHVTGSDGTQTDLTEICLEDLHLTEQQTEALLSALGYNSVDSIKAVNICAYSVPDIINYYLTGTCSFMGKERTSYKLDIVTPPVFGGHDSIRLTSTTSIPTAIGMDSLAIRNASAQYNDSFAAVYAYVTVPDTFGNFLRYKTKRNNEPFYTGKGGSVYDDKFFVGLKVDLPIERGTAPGADFDLKTDTYFFRGDTVTVKWSNIDSRTYQFFYTLENDGGGSPFSSPIKIKTNITNGLGVWGGYATKYYTIIVPK